MTPTAHEIETIVRRVLRTLSDRGASSPSESVAVAQRLALREQVISFESVKNKLAGIEVLQIAKSAVITPAAKDYCRSLNVEVVRGDAAITKQAINKQATSQSDTVVSAPMRPQRLIVSGTADWLPAIGKQLCSKQAKVLETSMDDTSSMRAVAEGIRAGHQAGIVIVNGPHAACWQSARDDRLRPAVLSSWSELGEVLREVPLNLLILSTKTWNIPSVCNVARKLFQHLQSQS